jgi:2-phosphosulfolactate phosphatase
MRVDLYFTPNQIDETQFRDKVVVVIDVLRASTSIATALHNGAREIIPVTTVESAVKISGNLVGAAVLLGGERNGKTIEGFHLGNSPLEYTEEKVKGKSIIFSSTNGSQAIAKAHYARDLVVCGFVNVGIVAEFLGKCTSDIIIVCAGDDGRFSMEDSVCAGLLIRRLSRTDGVKAEHSDAALAAVTLYKSFGKSTLKMIQNSEHGKYLIGIGFADDCAICARVDSIPVLPQLVGNVIKVKTATEKKELAAAPITTS